MWNVSGRLSYDLSKKFLLVDNIIFGNGTIIKPFSIDDDYAVSELDILLKNGKINFKNINLSENNFSLGCVKFFDVDISQFCETGLNGILNGSGEYCSDTKKAKLKLSNFAFDSIKISNIDIDISYSKDKINLKVKKL